MGRVRANLGTMFKFPAWVVEWIIVHSFIWGRGSNSFQQGEVSSVLDFIQTMVIIIANIKGTDHGPRSCASTTLSYLIL